LEIKNTAIMMEKLSCRINISFKMVDEQHRQPSALRNRPVFPQVDAETHRWAWIDLNRKTVKLTVKESGAEIAMSLDFIASKHFTRYAKLVF
jgi:hypothetical protein